MVVVTSNDTLLGGDCVQVVLPFKQVIVHAPFRVKAVARREGKRQVQVSGARNLNWTNNLDLRRLELDLAVRAGVIVAGHGLPFIDPASSEKLLDHLQGHGKWQ